MMKPALTTTTTIISCVLAAGFASAQSPSTSASERHACSGQAARSRGGYAGEVFFNFATGRCEFDGHEKNGRGKAGSGSRGRAQGASEASAYGSEEQSACGRQRSP